MAHRRGRGRGRGRGRHHGPPHHGGPKAKIVIKPNPVRGPVVKVKIGGPPRHHHPHHHPHHNPHHNRPPVVVVKQPYRPPPVVVVKQQYRPPVQPVIYVNNNQPPVQPIYVDNGYNNGNMYANPQPVVIQQQQPQQVVYQQPIQQQPPQQVVYQQPIQQQPPPVNPEPQVPMEPNDGSYY